MDWLRKHVESGTPIHAASQLPPPPIPKVKNKQQSFPSYIKTTQQTDSLLPVVERNTAGLDITTYRAGASTQQVIHDLASVSPDLAAAVNAYLRTAISEKYTAVARNTDGTFNRDATQLLQQILTRFNVLGNYDDGFSGVGSIRSVAESLGKELMYYGACSLELVLDKTRLPRTLAPVSVPQIFFYPDGQWLRPIQRIGGEQIDLDIPTFFYVSLDQDLLAAYPSSPLEPALQPVLFSADFMNDLRRVVKRAIHPRMNVTIDEEKFRKNIPAEAKHSEQKLREYMDSLISQIQDKVNGLNPEDALVFFDSIGVAYMNNGNVSLDSEYKTLSTIMDAKLATGAKALPSILGHGSGSQNIASTETMLFMKNADGAVRVKLNEIFSKALTLALRLFGQDVYVEFAFASIELRPETELESFYSMRQSRILEQLSFGFITDDEAAILLTGNVTPDGYTPLQGTQFMQPMTGTGRPDAGAAGGGTGNGYTNQSTGGAGGGGPTDRKPATPTGVKGPARKQPGAQLEVVSAQ